MVQYLPIILLCFYFGSRICVVPLRISNQKKSKKTQELNFTGINWSTSLVNHKQQQKYKAKSQKFEISQ